MLPSEPQTRTGRRRARQLRRIWLSEPVTARCDEARPMLPRSPLTRGNTLRRRWDSNPRKVSLHTLSKWHLGALERRAALCQRPSTPGESPPSPRGGCSLATRSAPARISHQTRGNSAPSQDGRCSVQDQRHEQGQVRAWNSRPSRVGLRSPDPTRRAFRTPHLGLGTMSISGRGR